MFARPRPNMQCLEDPDPIDVRALIDTGHGRQRVDDHDGHGVNDDALQDAVEHPLSPPSYQINEQGKGAYLYQGKDASVVLNKDGQVVTAWPRSRQGWRH